MVPLDARHADDAWCILDVLSRRGRGIGWVTLRRALLDGRRGLWADDAIDPCSVVFVREGGERVEAFGMGAPNPAVGWLVGLDRPVALVAPGDWDEAVRARAPEVALGKVVTWVPGPFRHPPGPPRAATRRLTARDADAFAASAPDWALRNWPTFESLLGHGAAFGVPFGAGFASLAWVFDQTESFDALGAHTAPRYRGLGLARAAASALVEHVIRDRRKIPLWAASPANQPSEALARSLGFTPRVTEPLFLWPPSPEPEPAAVGQAVSSEE
jgi:hypothetical protein